MNPYMTGMPEMQGRFSGYRAYVGSCGFTSAEIVAERHPGAGPYVHGGLSLIFRAIQVHNKNGTYVGCLSHSTLMNRITFKET